MSELKISEVGTVQFPIVAHAAEIGWTAVAPEVAKRKRGASPDQPPDHLAHGFSEGVREAGLA